MSSPTQRHGTLYNTSLITWSTPLAPSPVFLSLVAVARGQTAQDSHDTYRTQRKSNDYVHREVTWIFQVAWHTILPAMNFPFPLPYTLTFDTTTT